MSSNKAPILKLAVFFTLVTSLLFYLSYQTTNSFRSGRNQTINDPDETLVNKPLEQQPIEIGPIYLMPVSKDQDESSETIPATNELIEDNDFTVISPVNNSADSLGKNSVLTINYNLDSPGKVKLTIPPLNYTAYSFRWGSGSIKIGDNKNDLLPILPVLDEGETLRGFVSDLYYEKLQELFIQADNATTLSIDLYNVSHVSSDPVASVTEIQNSDSGAKFSSLNIISRDVWGASPSRWDQNSSLDIDDPARFTWEPGYFRVSRFVIHHTASPNNASDPSQAVRDIYMYHAYSRGWGDIGYNYLIDAWGNIYEGKGGGDEVYGYHSYTEANTMSIGIALIGNFDSEYPTYAAKQALIKLMAEKAAFYDLDLSLSDGSLSDWLDPNITVFGHKQSYFWCFSGHPLSSSCTSGAKWVVNNTACPGFHLAYDLQNGMITNAKNYKEQNFYSIKDTVISVNSLVDKYRSEIDRLYVKYDLPESTQRAIIESKIPKYSGIKEYEIYGNEVIIHLGGWNEGIPEYGFDGFNAPNTFFPTSEGKNDRIRTLMKVFELDPEVLTVAPFNKIKVSPIE